MSNKFFDVLPNQWFYKDVVELENLILDDDKSFISGFPFNKFVEGKEALDVIIEVFTAGTTVILDKVIADSNDNKLVAYVDGIKTVCSITPNTPVGKTTVTFPISLVRGQKVRLIQNGVPYVDPTTLRPEYPNTTKIRYPNLWFMQGYTGFKYLDNADNERVTINGTELLRREYPGHDQLHSNYRFFNSDYEYTISPLSGFMYLPYTWHNATVSIKFSYHPTGDSTDIRTDGYKTGTCKIPFNDPDQQLVYFGFFPDAKMTRAEFFTLLNNLRMYLIRKFSIVDPYRNDDPNYTSIYLDVSTAVSAEMASTGQYPWWWQHIRDMEVLKLSNGTRVIAPRPGNVLALEGDISRGELVTVLDNFRVWFIEAFK